VSGETIRRKLLSHGTNPYGPISCVDTDKVLRLAGEGVVTFVWESL